MGGLNAFSRLFIMSIFADLKIAAALANSFKTIDSAHANDFINIASEQLNVANNLADVD